MQIYAGDFAVLLRSGMRVKQALVYNIVSSVLCFIGMVGGLLLGNIEAAHGWIYALTAGIFIYISLVDMVRQYLMIS
jgi:zinc transporter ZupT